VKRVLIAEDEELFRHELETTLPWEAWGLMHVGSAEDGDEALRLIGDRRPDIVLCDIRMPGIDGLELMRRAHEAMPAQERPLFIVLSGHADFAYAREALRNGAFDYLIKPVDDAELESAVRKAVEQLDERDRMANLELAAESDKALDFLRELAEGMRSSLGAAADAYVESACADIAARYVSELTADTVAARLGISGEHLSRLFKKNTGLTFGEYLTRVRMRRALELLADPTVRVSEVADLAGYRDARYFSTLFKRFCGMTPSEFRHRRLQNNGDEKAQGR
jgi:two-component system response regulator YesN